MDPRLIEKEPGGWTKGDDSTAVAHLGEAEYSATGYYFGNEGSETKFYVYAALHVEVRAYGKGVRRVRRKKGG
ncbi:MAG: hypothetical protein U0Q16_34220 [Bryobacteraceae bacterium]